MFGEAAKADWSDAKGSPWRAYSEAVHRRQRTSDLVLASSLSQPKGAEGWWPLAVANDESRYFAIDMPRLALTGEAAVAKIRGIPIHGAGARTPV